MNADKTVEQTKVEKKLYKVAVYGSLRKGFGNYGLLERGNAKLLGEANLEPKYTMINLGAFPGVYKGGNTSITVEIYEVDEHLLSMLDSLEGYSAHRKPINNFYNREVVNIPGYGKTYIYFIEDSYKEYNAPIIESGDWKNYRRGPSN